jgi:hypothetical protein
MTRTIKRRRVYFGGKDGEPLALETLKIVEGTNRADSMEGQPCVYPVKLRICQANERQIGGEEGFLGQLTPEADLAWKKAEEMNPGLQ